MTFESIFFGQKLSQTVSIKNNFPVEMKVINSKISSSFLVDFIKEDLIIPPHQTSPLSTITFNPLEQPLL